MRRLAWPLATVCVLSAGGVGCDRDSPKARSSAGSEARTSSGANVVTPEVPLSQKDAELVAVRTHLLAKLTAASTVRDKIDALRTVYTPLSIRLDRGRTDTYSEVGILSFDRRTDDPKNALGRATDQRLTVSLSRMANGKWKVLRAESQILSERNAPVSRNGQVSDETDAFREWLADFSGATK